MPALSTSRSLREVTYSSCHRCHADLPSYDDGTLIYCPHCGAPQISLSEELQSQDGEGGSALAGADGTTAPAPVLRWRGAIRCAALAGAIAAGLAIVSQVAPPVALLGFLWIVISPVVVLGIFQSRYPHSPVNSAFGARLGLVTGLFVAAALSIVNTIVLAVDRRRHALGDFDSRIAQIFDQLRAQLATQPGGDVTGLSQKLVQPEFRAGYMLSVIAIAMVLMLALTTAGGAFAGFLRSRRNA